MIANQAVTTVNQTDGKDNKSKAKTTPKEKNNNADNHKNHIRYEKAISCSHGAGNEPDGVR
jgi:hypothetical protein